MRRTHPAFRWVVRTCGTGPSVHPDRPLLLLPLDVRGVSDDGLGLVVDNGADTQIADAAKPVSRWVRLALMFGHGQQRSAPTVGPEPRRVGDRQAGVVADVRAGHALDLILVHDRGPIAGQIHLRECGRAGGGDCGGEND